MTREESRLLVKIASFHTYLHNSNMFPYHHDNAELNHLHNELISISHRTFYDYSKEEVLSAQAEQELLSDDD